MNEKEYCNTFRFSLYQGDVMLGEKVFDADTFNPITRYSIDIRHLLPRIISNLQKILSKKNYVTKYDNNCDFLSYNKKLINSYPHDIRESFWYNPVPIVQHIENKVIRGVECKIGFYINDKPIVERLFYVDGFNPVSRYSIELINLVISSTDIIYNHIKECDVNNMWDDYDLINVRGLNINQIRELAPSKREELIRKLKKY